MSNALCDGCGRDAYIPEEMVGHGEEAYHGECLPPARRPRKKPAARAPRSAAARTRKRKGQAVADGRKRRAA